MSQTYQRIVLASRPNGTVTSSNFRMEEVKFSEIKSGEVLVRNHYLSLDPYMRGRMDDNDSYAKPQPLNETMLGSTVGEVISSKNPKFRIGDKVLGQFGWTEMAISDGANIQIIEPKNIPLSAYLGAIGMPGVTAWYGLKQIIQPKPGEIIVVSAASGAVGGTVGQLAKLMGCRTIGIAGGPEKCDYVVKELGFDACIDYKLGNLEAGLSSVCPTGIDGLFENVGGEIFDSSLKLMNPFGRIAACGMISEYDSEKSAIRNIRMFVTKRLMMKGFIISEHLDIWPQGLLELEELVSSGKLKFKESISLGLASAPEAFMGLLKGKNFGKQLVKLI